MKFYKCTNCDQIYMKINDTNNKMTCCDIDTTELIVNDVPDELQNHQPVLRKTGNFITVTVNNHPMLDIHHIKFICLETNKGFQYRDITQTISKADFILAKDETITSIYLYCNLHGLWQLESN